MKIMRLLPILNALIRVKVFKVKVPLFVSWQITQRCNLRCKYCDYWMGSKEEELSTQEVFKIIDELHDLGTLAISFTGGEPLLRDDIGRVLDYAKAKGIATKINTNGLLIPQRMNEIKRIDQVNLSFDGPEEIHDRVRGLGSYNAMLKAVDVLRANKIKVACHATLTKYNLTAIDFILDKCRQLDIGVFFQPATELFLLNKNVNPHSPDRREYAKAISLLIQKKRNGNRFIYNSVSGLKHLLSWPQPKSIYCTAGKIMFRINSQGEFYHCERFSKIDKINCAKNGVKAALDSLRFVSCSQCWCGPLVELNLSMMYKFDAIINGLRL